MEPDNKEILINNATLISDIQHEFSASYPFLKIEFLSATNKSKNGRSIVLDAHTPLRQLASVKPHKVDINRNRTVAEVSAELQNTYGVIVQVSRKSGSVWSMISISDSWTLQSQNFAAQYITAEMSKTPVEPIVNL